MIWKGEKPELNEGGYEYTTIKRIVRRKKRGQKPPINSFYLLIINFLVNFSFLLDTSIK